MPNKNEKQQITYLSSKVKYGTFDILEEMTNWNAIAASNKVTK